MRKYTMGLLMIGHYLHQTTLQKIIFYAQQYVKDNSFKNNNKDS